ncbi:MAG: hypothetical protein ACE5E7_07450 [Anaerolineae bacterium]
MLQLRTHTSDYWGPEFALSDDDIEQIYNHFLEAERPQTAVEIARVIIAYRVAEEVNHIQKLLAGRTVYQPKLKIKVGDELVFPVMHFAHSKVTAIRQGYNPQHGTFVVITVKFNGKEREFAAGLDIDHPLNTDYSDAFAGPGEADLQQLFEMIEDKVAARIAVELEDREEFVNLADKWFIKALLPEVNIGHLHLTEAVLEINEGGPLSTDEILVHLDMDSSADAEVQRFALDYSLLHDDRFDEVAPQGKVAWFLRRMEPHGVVNTPERLVYTPIPYDRALLSPQLLLLERELDDEWSELEAATTAQPVMFSLLYPHRWAGTIPLSSRIRPLFPPSNSARQRIRFIDEFTNEEIIGWVVQNQRYVYGLTDWYAQNGIPVGGFVHLSPGPEPDVITLGFDRRRAQREWVRLATVTDNRITFDLMRRAVGCGYDDLLIVGTDVVAAVDALWRRAENNQRSVASLLAEIFPELAKLNPQHTVHAKTLYSAINMLRRVPPGPLFAELVRHPAFQPVGDHYWRFDYNRWRDSD